MQVFKNAPVEIGSSATASVTVRINLDKIYVGQVQMTIRDDLINETVYNKVFRTKRFSSPPIDKGDALFVTSPARFNSEYYSNVSLIYQ